MFFFHPKCFNLVSRLNHSLSSFHKFVSPTHQTLHSLLSKCSSVDHLHQIHSQLILSGLTTQILTLSKLISLAALSFPVNLHYAHQVFNRIPQPNKFMYNTLIRAYSNSNNDPIKSILLYRQMIDSGLSPNEFTLPFVLKACATGSSYWVSITVHGQALKLGYAFQTTVQNGLINVYVGYGFVVFARKVFDEMCDRTLVSWNLMISGYSKAGHCKEAFLLFKRMRELKVEPDGFTLASLISACSQRCLIYFGKYMHLFIVISGVEIDLIVWNALLDMYAKCGHLWSSQRVFEQMPDKNVVSWTSMINAYAKDGLVEFARRTFDLMPVKNVVSWNSMISCYALHNKCRDALDLFRKMCDLRVAPDEATLLSVLSACSQVGDLVMGKKIHDYICCNLNMPGVMIHNSLIDMYAKCGALETAMHVFYNMPNKNLVSWNTVIGGLALHGHGVEAVDLFGKMQDKGIWPDEITFTGLLSACGHSGIVEKGQYYFDAMNSVYGISQEIEHYACMVDLLGRRGLLREAVRLIGGMPMRPDIVIWGALLGACRTYGHVEIGKQVLKQLLELEPYSSGLYVLLANLFSEAQRWEDVKNIRKLMTDNRISKCRAISFIEIEGIVHEFMVDDKRHEFSIGIYSMLDQLTDHLKSMGSSLETSSTCLRLQEREFHV